MGWADQQNLGDGVIRSVRIVLNDFSELFRSFGDIYREHIKPGLWNVFPTVRGDHMWLQGGLIHRHDIRAFYLDLLGMIDGLPEPGGEKNG